MVAVEDFGLASREEFDEIALAYDALWTARLYDDEILAALPLKVDFILDLGCGVGALTRKLSARAKNVLGVDISRRAVELAQEHTTMQNIKYKRIAIEDLPAALDPLSCDAIVASRALHHCKDLEVTVAGLMDLLRPGGTVVILELASTGRFAGGRVRRCLISWLYRLLIIIKGVRQGQFRSALCGLHEEHKLFSTRLWKEHLENEPNFRWKALMPSFRTSGIAVSASSRNVRFKLMVGTKH